MKDRGSGRWTLGRAVMLMIGLVVAGGAWYAAIGIWASAKLEQARASLEERIGPLEEAPSPPAPTEADGEGSVALSQVVALLDLDETDRHSIHDGAYPKPNADVDGPMGSGGSAGPNGTPEDREHQRHLREALAKNREPLDLLEVAFERNGANRAAGFDSSAFSKPENFLHLIHLARLIRAEAAQSVSRGDTHEAVRAIEKGFRLTESMGVEEDLMTQLIRMAMDNVLHGAVLDLLAHRDPSDEDLVRIQEAIAGSWKSDPFVAAMTGVIRDSHRNISEGAFEGYLVKYDGWDATSARVWNWILKPYTKLEHRTYLRLMDDLLEYQALPPSERDDREWMEKQEAQLPWYAGAASIAIPNLLNGATRRDLMKARHVVTTTAIALRRHRLATGSYPKSLGELVPRYLESRPVDPFTGMPPEYRREGDGFFMASEGENADYAGSPKVDKNLTWRLLS